LKTIEVINISDINLERDSVEFQLKEFYKKKENLDKLEADLEKEKLKMEEKKRKRNLSRRK
jgi:hypothetical protein